ncbi:hypothetical protein Q4603_17645 [Zobellia galactanivorans]|uniref:Uncharacterized protein n=1 Tax=Zobellia galactanivorans (strain DSM 12802 / CCUG 47099 / CIP 106680 / NCIMB 13871 / Dsij) TaxID=63186 RepID=G0L2Q8_ZOBGA|nr:MULTISPECIES: hypothetical protein [Zobellia]MBU3028378.1 hypothetical protein [Zobellia galactanivorans]MDO6519583.1 hypothetical protein [Zobellia uliginosa]MDO6810451.1 hypothetical protein [Zobellia galactanivorans]CAZ95133.1 Putative protein [Zobellia galactanivorans]
MKPTSLIGIASALASSRKLKLALVGMQFAYLGYKLIQSKESGKGRKKRKKLKG